MKRLLFFGLLMAFTFLGCYTNLEKPKKETKQKSFTLPETSPQIDDDTTVTDITKQRCQAITKKGTQCKRSATENSKYCWQHQNYETVKPDSSYKENRTIYTGPRGGHYYYNSKGKKTYVRKKK